MTASPLVQHLACFYTCKKCGQEKVPFEVRARQENEELQDWMMRVGMTAQHAHDVKQLFCNAQDIKILTPHMEGARWIGDYGTGILAKRPKKKGKKP